MIDTNIFLFKQIVFTLSVVLCFGYGLCLLRRAFRIFRALRTLKQDRCDFDQELVNSIGIHHSHVGQR